MHHYSDDALARLRFIKRAQGLGFSLREVAILVDLGRRDNCACVRDLAARKLALVEKELDELETRREALRALLAECDVGGSRSGCPMLERLHAGDLTP